MSVEVPPLAASVLPVLIRSEAPGQPLLGTTKLCAEVEQCLREHGAVVLRGFACGGQAGLSAFASSFGQPLLSFKHGSMPHTSLGAGVYSSTETPAHRSIALHNEQSYQRTWPMKLWFYCERAADSGGDKPLADSRRVYARVPASLRERFAREGLMYVRNYGGGLDIEWSRAFGTGQRAEVERICELRGIQYEWFGRQQLCTRERVQAVAQHPRTREHVWFNQAHLFHSSALPPDERAALLDVCGGEERLPRNVYLGDGTPLADGMLDEIRAALEAEKVTFPWLTGDVLMLDNMLVAHSREPFSGPRKVLVAMAEPHSGSP